MFKTVKSFLKKLFSKKNALPLLAGIILLFLLCNMSYQGGLVEGFVEGQRGAWVNNESKDGCPACKDAWKEEDEAQLTAEYFASRGKEKRKLRTAMKKKRWNLCKKCRCSQDRWKNRAECKGTEEAEVKKVKKTRVKKTQDPCLAKAYATANYGSCCANNSHTKQQQQQYAAMCKAVAPIAKGPCMAAGGVCTFPSGE